MNKVLKSAVGAVSAAAVMLTAGIAAYAEDVSLSIEPITTNGNWKQSVVYTTANADNGLDFDPESMTPDSVVMVEYECTDQDTAAACWIELIWQSWGDNNTGKATDWAKVDAYEFGEGYANFSYSDIVASYGTEDFSEVYNICVGDKGAVVTAKSITITNVNVSAAAETEAEVTEAAEAETTAEETAAEETTAEETTAEETTAEETTAEETTAEETTAEETTTEAETEKETEAQTTAKTEKVTEAATEAASTAPVSDDGDIAGVILVIAIVLVAAAIIIIVYLTVQRGGYSRRGK